jgi:hypothetical protein
MAELFSIVDADYMPVSINTTYFPGTASGFWSSSLDVSPCGGCSVAWCLYFAGGQSGMEGTSQMHSVRCVR